jgi:hypothetical protein
MLHRSTLLAILSAVLLLPAAAQAADPVVAGPLPDGTSASAKLDRGRLCLTMRLPDSVDEPYRAAAAQSGRCDVLPVLGPLGYDPIAAYAPGRTTFAAGATGTDVAAVELRAKGRTLAHVATQASALPGAPDLRFYAIEATGAPDEVAFLDATGAVRRAADFSDDGGPSSTSISDGPLLAGPRPLAHGRGLGQGTWTLNAYSVDPIASTPLQPERRLTRACVQLVLRGAAERQSESGCDQDAAQAAQVLPAFTTDGCGTVGRYVGLLVRSRVARVVLVQGDGTRKDLTLRPVPAALGGAGLRVALAVIDPRQAIRSTTAYDAAGHVIDTGTGGYPPHRPDPCRHTASGGGGILSVLETFSTGGLASTARLGAGPHRIQATDSGALICAAADRAPSAPGDCTQPPMDAESVQLGAQPAADGRLIAAIVPPEVAGARVTLDDGSTRDLPAGPIPDYAGQYASTLALIATDVPGPHRVVAYRLLDARGRVFVSGYGPELPALHDTRAVARVPGVGTLFHSSLDVAPAVRFPSAFGSCLSVGRPTGELAFFYSSCIPTYTSGVVLQASCRTHRFTITAGLAHRTDRVVVRLASGRSVTLRNYALPKERSAALATTLAIGTLGPHDAPRTIIRRGASPARLRVTFPAAGEQCGYDDAEELGSPFSD